MCFEMRVLDLLAQLLYALGLKADALWGPSAFCYYPASISVRSTLRIAVSFRKITSLVDKVNAERLRREFKSFNAFMKQLDEKASPGEPCTRSVQLEPCSL